MCYSFLRSKLLEADPKLKLTYINHLKAFFFSIKLDNVMLLK
jgi:hypothetical protein